MGAKKSRPKRNNRELIEAFEQVLYEAKMLEYCGNRLPPHQEPLDKDFAVLMESFLIHARNLDAFFYGLKRVNAGEMPCHVDDVFVEDFFEDDTPLERPLKNQLSEKERRDINKQLAHISYMRSISNRDTWNFKSMRERLQPMVNEFISVVPIVESHPRLKRLVEKSTTSYWIEESDLRP